ncbi:hypothetical protein TNCV_540741 [Trichonephila clavipes]|nr:hypothetical protein TNCV_540741 [Trichonephila clavipes]
MGTLIEMDKVPLRSKSSADSNDSIFANDRKKESRQLHKGKTAMGFAILNHAQVTRTTPELALPSPNYHTTPMGPGAFEDPPC